MVKIGEEENEINWNRKKSKVKEKTSFFCYLRTTIPAVPLLIRLYSLAATNINNNDNLRGKFTVVFFSTSSGDIFSPVLSLCENERQTLD